MAKAGHIIITQSSGLSAKLAWGNGLVMAPKSDGSLGWLNLDCFSFIVSFPMKTKRAFKHKNIVQLRNIYLIFHTDKTQND